MLNDGSKPNLIACNALINSLRKTGEVKLAFKIYDCMKSLGHTPDDFMWNSLLGALYRANQHADALHLFERIKEQSSLVNVYLYNTALMSCQKHGSWDRALQLYGKWKLQDCWFQLHPIIFSLVLVRVPGNQKRVPPNVSLYNTVIHGMCLRGKVESAKKLYLRMQKNGLKPDSKTRALMLQNLRKDQFKVKRLSYHHR
ncbi:hypothetical protein CRYUN_Cryun17cG0040200 [Craigia yunnanensis]